MTAVLDTLRRVARRAAIDLPPVDPELASAGHGIRRLGFDAQPGRSLELLQRHGSAAAVIEQLRTAPPLPFDPPGDIDTSLKDERESLSADALIQWWLKRMATPEAGLHERMIWFWHTHFTTSVDKASPLLCWRQLRSLHTHALGNFGELLTAMVHDGAMIQYLDGDGSQASAPNENLARELMELFSLGRNQYTQRDVASLAYGLSGHSVNWEEGTIDFDPSRGPRWPGTFLGSKRVWNPGLAVEQILEQQPCAPFIVGRIWHAIVGTPLDPSVHEQLAGNFRASGYELAPLLEEIIGSVAFGEAQNAKPRSGLEWLLFAQGVLDVDTPEIWSLHSLGQMPFHPPTVAGWPNDRVWTSASSAMARAGHIGWLETGDLDFLLDSNDVVEAVLTHCSLTHASEPTRLALKRVAAAVPPEEDRTRVELTLKAALLTPEAFAC